MPAGSAKSRRNHTFSYNGVNYRFSVPADWTEEQAKSVEADALSQRVAVPVRPTIDIEDSTPFEVGPLYRQPDAPGALSPDTSLPPLNQDEIDYAKRGILSNYYTKHFSLEDTTQIGAAKNKHYAQAHIAKLLKNKWQADIAPEYLTRVDPKTGEILYLDYKSPGNPNGTNRWVRYQGTGPWGIAQGVAEAGGYAVGAAPGFFMGNPALMAGGGAAGAGVAGGLLDYAKTGYGQSVGVWPDIPGARQRSAFAEAGKAGALSLGADTLFGIMARPGRINSYFFDTAYEKEFEKGMAESEAIVARIRELEREYGGTGERFNPSPAQRSNVQELLDLEATLRANQSSTSRAGHAEQIRKRQTESQRAIEEVLDGMLPETGVDPTWGASRVGESVQEAVRRSPDVADMQAEEALQQRYRDAVAAYTASTKGVDRQEALEAVRIALEGSKKEQRDLEKAAWAAVDDKIGLNVTEVPGTKPKLQWTPEGPKVIQPGKVVDYKLTDSHFVSINVNDPNLASIMQKWRQGQNVFFDGASVDRLAPQVRQIIEAAEKGERIPLSTLMNGVKQLRAIEREVLAPTATTPWKMDQAFLVELTNKFTAIRDNYLRQFVPDAVPALEAAESITRRITDTYYRTNGVKDLLRKVANNPNEDAYGTTAIIRKLFPGDDGPMRALMREIGNDPEAVAGLRAIAYQKYVTDVLNTTNNTVSPRAYEKFIQQHGRTYEALLDPKDWAAMKELGGLGDALARSQARFKASQAAFEKMFPKIPNMNADAIVRGILGRGTKINMHELSQLKTFLNGSSDPAMNDLWEEVVSASSAMIREKLMGPRATLEGLNPAKINSLLENAPRLEMIFGEKYVSDLRTVMHGLSLLKRSGTSFTVPAETPALTMFRWIWGPLSRTQRFLTASRKYQIQGYERTLVNILSDPNKLRAAIKHGNLPVASDAAAPIIALLGINYVNEDGTGNESPFIDYVDQAMSYGANVADKARKRVMAE